MESDAPAMKPENDENIGSLAFSPGNQCSDEKYNQKLQQLANRNAKLKKAQLARRAGAKKHIDLEAIERTFMERTQLDESQFSTETATTGTTAAAGPILGANLSSSTQSLADGPFLVPQLPGFDVSAIANDSSSMAFDCSVVNRNAAPVSSTPLNALPINKRARLQRGATVEIESPKFKAPHPPKRLQKEAKSVDAGSSSSSKSKGNTSALRKKSQSSSSVAPAQMDFAFSIEEKMQKQLDALASWANVVLRGGMDLDEMESDAPAMKPENDENIGSLAFSPGNKCSDEKYNQKLQQLANRNAKLKKAQLARRAGAKKHIDLEAIERTFMERTQLDESQFSTDTANTGTTASAGPVLGENLSSSTQSLADGPFLVPQLPGFDVSAIANDSSSMAFDCSVVNRNAAPVSSTPLNTLPINKRARLQRAATLEIESPKFKVDAGSSSSSKSKGNTSALRKKSQASSSVAPAQMNFAFSIEEKMQKQLDALASWANVVLRGGIDLDEVELGRTKEEAKNSLARLLQKKSDVPNNVVQPKNYGYKDWVKRRKMDKYREIARTLYKKLEYDEPLTRSINYGYLKVKEGLRVYSDVSLQSTLLRLLFSFHPLWLHLALETVFNVTIDIREEDNFIQKLVLFMKENLFINTALLKLKKFSKNGKVSLVTPEGNTAQHAHFMRHISLMIIFIEEMKRGRVIPHAPRMFAKASGYKSMNDVFTELSREVFSATGKSYGKVLMSAGFQSTYKQTFYEEYTYRITQLQDLTDGVILAKLVEILTEAPCHEVMMKLRNPGGDRIRKLGNVQVVLDTLASSNVDTGTITPQKVVGGNKETVLELLWRIVGYYMERNGSPAMPVPFVCFNNKINRRLSILGLRAGMQRERSETGAAPSLTDHQTQTDGEALLGKMREVGSRIGIEVTSWNSLRDGRVLTEVWKLFTSNHPNVDEFPGKNSFEKVYNAADTVLGVPRCVFDDDRSISLFVHILVNKLMEMNAMHESAKIVQRAWRRWRLTKKQREERAAVAEETRRMETEECTPSLQTSTTTTPLETETGPTDPVCAAENTYVILNGSDSALRPSDGFKPATTCSTPECHGDTEREGEANATIKEEVESTGTSGTDVTVIGVNETMNPETNENVRSREIKEELLESAMLLVEMANAPATHHDAPIDDERMHLAPIKQEPVSFVEHLDDGGHGSPSSSQLLENGSVDVECELAQEIREVQEGSGPNDWEAELDTTQSSHDTEEEIDETKNFRGSDSLSEDEEDSLSQQQLAQIADKLFDNPADVLAGDVGRLRLGGPLQHETIPEGIEDDDEPVQEVEKMFDMLEEVEKEEIEQRDVAAENRGEEEMSRRQSDAMLKSKAVAPLDPRILDDDEGFDFYKQDIDMGETNTDEVESTSQVLEDDKEEESDATNQEQEAEEPVAHEENMQGIDVEQEEFEVEGHMAGEGLILERSMIDGEISFGWREATGYESETEADAQEEMENSGLPEGAGNEDLEDGGEVDDIADPAVLEQDQSAQVAAEELLEGIHREGVEAADNNEDVVPPAPLNDPNVGENVPPPADVRVPQRISLGSSGRECVIERLSHLSHKSNVSDDGDPFLGFECMVDFSEIKKCKKVPAEGSSSCSAANQQKTEEVLTQGAQPSTSASTLTWPSSQRSSCPSFDQLAEIYKRFKAVNSEQTDLARKMQALWKLENGEKK